jgi:signal transduction histidine kinase
MPYRPGKSPVAARSFIVGFVSVDAQPGQQVRPYAAWRMFLRFEVSISVLIGGGLALGWLLTGAHGPFWPAWVWFGLALPLWLQGSVLWGLRVPRGRRFMALHVSVSFAIAVMFLVIWMLAGFHYFWPVWPILGLSVLLALHVWAARGRSEAREQELTDRVDVLTRTRRGALDIQAAELQRIERDLHDGAQARLVSVAMSLGLAESLLASKPHELPGLLTEARSTTLAALDDLRTLMRGIQPPVLADRGLEGAVRALALDVAVPVTVGGTLPGRPPVPVESAVYFTVAECLANVVKHSEATSASVSLRYGGGLLSVTVGDNGRGGAHPGGGTGLRGVARRLESFDGKLAFSSPPGGPTTVTMEVPCELSSPRT